MYNIGDHIVYGVNGVCRITAKCPSPFDRSDDRLYYVLKPAFYFMNSTIYTPVDNDKVVMRPLLAADEAEELIEKMPSVRIIRIQYDKSRREVYREAMAKCDPVEYIKIIKTVNMRRSEFKSARKWLPETDATYELMAKKHLYSELSMVLKIDIGRIEEYIKQKIEERERVVQ